MSLPRYPAYKDSGVEWLGEVPGHWAVTRLGRELPEPPRNGVSPDVAQTGSRPSFSTAAVDGGRVDIAEHLKFVELDERGARPFLVSTGDLLLLRGSGSKERVGSAGLVMEEPPAGCVYPDILIRLRLGANWFPVYGVRLLNSAAVRPQMELAAQTAAGIWKISGGALRDLVVPRPPAQEQQAIAAFLDRETAKIDALVTEQQHLIELLREKRQAVISHAVTKGLNPDAPMKDSGIAWLGEVPAAWRVTTLKRIADVNTGVAKGKDNTSRATITVPYLRVANVQDGYLDLETVAEIEIPSSELGRYALKRGDVLMNEGGDFDKLGRGCVWDGQIEPCITQNHVFAVRPRDVSSTWLNAITSSDLAQFYFMTRSKQSTNLASIWVRLNLDDAHAASRNSHSSSESA